MNTKISIRTFRNSDYDRAYGIWRGTEGIGLSEADSREGIRLFLRRNRGLSRVAVAGNRVIAAVLCGHDGRRGYLHHLAVARKWRRMGIGTSLVTSCLEGLRKEGIPKCNLFLFARNKKGRAFWKRVGWDVRSDIRLAQCGTTAPVGDRTQC